MTSLLIKQNIGYTPAMKKLTTYSAYLMIALGLSGCVSADKYQQAVNTWQDTPVEALIGAWGYPKTISTLPNGDKLYSYEVTHVLPGQQATQSPDLSKSDKAKQQKVNAQNSAEQKTAAQMLPPGHKYHMLKDKNQTGVIIIEDKNLLNRLDHWFNGLVSDSGSATVKQPKVCHTSFEVNQNNEIVNIKHQGNYCLATDMFVKEMSNPADNQSAESVSGSNSSKSPG